MAGKGPPPSKLGLDVIDEPLKAAARSLLGEVKQGKRAEAFQAWEEHASLETSISSLERAVKPFEAILNSLPQDRSKEDVQNICGLLREMKAFKAFAPHILEFIGCHCQLLLVWEGVELPRTGEEACNLYNVICGEMQCVVADPADPLISYTVHDAAFQILKEEATAAAAAPAGEDENVPGSPRSPRFKTVDPVLKTPSSTPAPASPLILAQKRPAEQSNTDKDTSPHVEARQHINNADSITTYKLPLKCEAHSVASKLWRTVLGRIQAGSLLTRSEAEAALAARNAKGSQRTGSRQRVRRRSSMGVRVANQGSCRQPTSIGAAEDAAVAVGKGGFHQGQFESSERGWGTGRVTQEGTAVMGGPNNPWPNISTVDLKRGSGFSGRELDCFNEVGLMEGGEALDIPIRAIAAVPARNSVAALLVVSRAIYRRALDMVQEHTIACAVNHCCRLPFLRHTPLKELYKLARHLTEVRFYRGDTLIEQGKESSNLYLLIEGEVEVVVDVPYTDNREVLENALAAKMQDNGLEGRNSVAPSVWSSWATKTAPYQGPLQRVVLARRGPGSILGDDGLREKKMAVGVVVGSSNAVALTVSHQRFGMSVDPLTLRLFLKLKQQQGAIPLLSQAVSAALMSRQKVEHCREVIIAESYETQALPRTLVRVKPDSASKDPLLQSLLGSPTGAKPAPVPWCRIGSHVHKPPILSLDTGDRIDNLAELHKRNQEAYELEVRLQILATRSDKKIAGGEVPPGSPGKKSQEEVGGGKGSSGTGMLTPAAIAAHKSLTRSSRTMKSSIFGGLGGANRTLPSSMRLGHGWPSMHQAEVAAERGLHELMPQSMKTSWMQKMQMTESVMQLRQMIKQAGDKRRAEVLEQEHRNLQGRSNLIKVDPRIVHKLDISIPEPTGSTRNHTDMLESACMAVIKVHMLHGQAVAPCDVLAPVLDDAVVGWSALAHKATLQLIRWSTIEYSLLARIDPSESKRAAVVTIADVLLEMKAHFDFTIQTNAVPHYTFCAGLALGGAFAQHKGGRFLTGISGTAVTAAHQLADEAMATHGTHGAILISDAAMQAICRTHMLRFGATAYELVGKVNLPCSTAFEDVFGLYNLENPVSKGTIPSNIPGWDNNETVDPYYSTTSLLTPPWRSNGFMATQDWPCENKPAKAPGSAADILDPSRTSPKHSFAHPEVLQPVPLSHEVLVKEQPELEAHKRCVLSQRNPSLSNAPDHLRVEVPSIALSSPKLTQSPGNISPQPSPMSQPSSPAAPSPQVGSLSLSYHSKPRWGPASLTTLETERRHAKVAAMRNRAELSSSMGVRQRLRQDLDASKAQQGGDLLVNASTGTLWGGLQGGLKSWGWDGHIRASSSSCLLKNNNQLRSQKQRQHRTPSLSSEPTSPYSQHWSVIPTAASRETSNWSQGSGLPSRRSAPTTYTQRACEDKPMYMQQEQQQQQSEQQRRQLSASSHAASPVHLRPAKQDVFEPFAPGSHPLGSLSARRRASEVLFAGAALASSASQSIRPFSPRSVSAPLLTPTSSPHSNPPPIKALGTTTHAQNLLDMAMKAALGEIRASTQRLLPQRPDSPLQVLRRPMSAHQKASVAGLAVHGRPKSAGSIGDGGPLILASPSLRLRHSLPSNTTPPSTPLAHGHACHQQPQVSSNKVLPSNYGLVPVSLLQYPRSARPQPGGGGLGDQDASGTRSWYPLSSPKSNPATPSQALPWSQPGSSPASSPIQPSRQGATHAQSSNSFTCPGTAEYNAAHAFGQAPPSAPPALRQAASTQSVLPSSSHRERATSQASTMCTPSAMHTPASTRSRHVDPYTGMSLTAIHKQAVSIWKDLGSIYSAQEYVEQLPQGQVVISFSAAGLTALPDLSRLRFLESLSASFNNFNLCPDPQSILGTSPLAHLSVLCMSHCGLKQLPFDIGRLVPTLTELNLARNNLVELPESLFQCIKLRAISLDHNQLSCISESLSHLTCLEALYVGSNSLHALPECLPNLPRLEVLNASNNLLKDLPANLPTCTNLAALSMAHNQLTALPPSFLISLTRLHWLELQGNSLKACPQINGPQVAAAVAAAQALASKQSAEKTEGRPGTAEEGEEKRGEFGGALMERRVQGHFAQQAAESGTELNLDAAQEDYFNQSIDKLSGAALSQSSCGASKSGTLLLQEQQQPVSPGRRQRPSLARTRRSSNSARIQLHPDINSDTAAAGAGTCIGSVQLLGSTLSRPSSQGRQQHTTSSSALFTLGPDNKHLLAASTCNILSSDIAQEALAACTSCCLPNLKWFNCSNNRLAVPPMWLPPSLTGLDLSRNRLPILPTWLINKLPNLQLLALHDNCITSVCHEVTSIHSLKAVCLEENPATDPDIFDESGGAWVAEHVQAAKFDHKVRLEAVKQKLNHGERPSDLESEVSADQCSVRSYW